MTADKRVPAQVVDDIVLTTIESRQPLAAGDTPNQVGTSSRPVCMLIAVGLGGRGNPSLSRITPVLFPRMRFWAPVTARRATLTVGPGRFPSLSPSEDPAAPVASAPSAGRSAYR